MKREALSKNTILHFSERPNIEFRIDREIGRGSSCIVYHAICNDNTEHLLKEYYPKGINVERNDTGCLMVNKDALQNFEQNLERFELACEQQKTVRLYCDNLKNYTSNIQGMYRANNTVYIDMTCFAGSTYKAVREKSLYELMLRMKTLAQVVGNYHNAGFLHLDIKPSNIFVRPTNETVEDVLLFDFDSVVKKDELLEHKSLSCTREWAAPEQLLPGKRNKICPATDIFAIGEIIFYQLFDRHSTRAERRSFVRHYEFDHELEIFKCVNPKVFPMIDELLANTVCGVVDQRYQSVDQLITILEKIIDASDTKKPYVNSNLPSIQASFVGREDELKNLKLAINDAGLLFVYGIGGIGKTELVKQYLCSTEHRYNKKIFVRYNGSLVDSICEVELQLGNYVKNDSDSQEMLYNRILNILSDDLTNEDLFVLDNFDSEDETEIEELINIAELIACRFIVTTRYDQSDYGFNTLEISEIADVSALMELFECYNRLEYDEAEKESIIELINFVDRHTMTVELIAKYIRDAYIMPSELLNKMKSSRGILSAENIKVKHRKDNRLNNKNVISHLHLLFDLFGFTDMEQEVLMSISIMGPVRIDKNLLCEICHDWILENVLEDLIRKGWIEEDKTNKKISLHQLILDMVYNELYPLSNNCSNIVSSMEAYFCKKTIGTIEKEQKKKLATTFIDRIKGDDIALAGLCYAYCDNVVYSEEVLNKALLICKENHDEMSRFIEIRISLLRFRKHAMHVDLFEVEDYEVYFNDIYLKINCLTMELYSILRDIAKQRIEKIDKVSLLEDQEKLFSESIYNINPTHKIQKYIIERDTNIYDVVNDSLLEIYLEIACFMEKLASDFWNECLYCDAEYVGLKSLLYDAENLFLYCVYLIQNKAVSVQMKEVVYKSVIDFYDPDNFMCMAKSSIVGDSIKCAFYYERLHALRDCDDSILNLDEITYDEAATHLMLDGDYMEAIDLWESELSDENAWDLLPKLSDAYEKVKDYEGAELNLLKILDIDIKNGVPTYFTKKDLARVYETSGNVETAISYYESIIEEFETLTGSSCLENQDVLILAKAKSDLLRYKLLSNSTMELMRKYVTQMKQEYILDYELLECYSKMIKQEFEEGNLPKTLNLAFEIADIARTKFYNEEALDFYRSIINYKDSFDLNPEKYVKALLWAAYCELMRDSDDVMGKSTTLISYAQELISDEIPDYRYCRALLYWVKSALYLSLSDYSYDELKDVQRKCDYVLLLQREIQNGEHVNDEFEAWKRCFDQCFESANYELAEKALLKLKHNLCDTQSLQKTITFYNLQVKLCVQIGDFEKVSYLCENIISNTIRSLSDNCSKNEINDVCRLIDETISYVEKTSCKELVITIYMFELVLYLNMKPLLGLFCGSSIFKSSKLIAIFDSITEWLPEHLEFSLVDKLCDILTCLAEFCSSDKSLEQIAGTCLQYVEKYSEQLLEFKW